MVIKYKGHSIGFNADHIPPGLPKRLEEILFPDTGDDIIDGDEYEETMQPLHEAVASALSEICPRGAPVLRQELIERVTSLATEKEMQALNYWQGRVTPQNSGIFEGIFQFSLLPGSDENVVNWWHFTFSKRRRQWRRKATDIYYLLHPWRGNKDEASSSDVPPAHAGIDLAPCWRTTRQAWLPRTRGDRHAVRRRDHPQPKFHTRKDKPHSATHHFKPC